MNLNQLTLFKPNKKPGNEMKKIAEIINNFNAFFGKAISWLSFILVLIVTGDVVSRYIFNASSVAVQELEWHIFAALFLLGATYTLRVDDHVRVDVMYSLLNNRKKAWINLIGTIVFLIPFCLLVIYTSYRFVYNSWLFGEISPDPGGLPARYIIKSVLPLSFLLLLIQGISMFLTSLINIMKLEDK